MATILFYGTHGPDDATRAVMPWHMAKGALEAGYKAKIALVGDASFLMKDYIAREVKGVALPNAAEIIAELAARGVEITV